MAAVRKSRSARRFCLAATLPILLACAGLFPQSLSQGAAASLEYAVKANYLLKFTKFIEWPAIATSVPNSSFNICVLGANPFGTALDQVVTGEVVNGAKASVQKLERQPAAGLCQILFMGDQDEAAKILPELGPGVLTVGEGGAFVRNGGMIGFVVENHHVTFDINWRAADAAGIKLSSGLLGVARSVIK